MCRKILIAVLLCLLISPLMANQQQMWDALRQSFKLPDQSSHPIVKAQIRWLIKHPAYMEEFAQNAEPYIYYVLETIKKEKLPGELALLPMIESNYNPFAYSKAGAAGLWQLMPGTGSGLGVKQNWWYDGRRGIISSTHAAIEYLKYLAHLFKRNWILAIAAYDSGEGTVLRAIKRNQKRRESTNFWSLKLPHETQAYLPRLLALASVIKYPRYFGIHLPESHYPRYFEEITVGSQIDLTHAAKLAGIKYSELLRLNPGHNRWATAPNRQYTLLLPIQKVRQFLQRLKQLPIPKRVSWRRHKIKDGESLSVIAHKEGSNIAMIKKVNNLNNDKIRAGKTLLIPKSSVNILSHPGEHKKQRLMKKIKQIGPHKIIHIVTSGDSVDKLAKKYHVNAGSIRFWNQLKSQAPLVKGQRIVIWKRKRKPQAQTYIVKNGDNLGYIAHKFHVRIADLKNWNPKLRQTRFIHPKQKLKVYT